MTLWSGSSHQPIPVMASKPVRQMLRDPDSTKRELAALLIGDSRPMRDLRHAIMRAGASSLPVLITGPTGSGKELVARGLHLASGRRGPLVAFNIAAVADTLFESALFGHVRGAFTGALASNPGYLAEAHGGTAFLDEIGALSLGAQAKLLRAVELKEFRPVGAAADRRSDFRLVSATNADMDALTQEGGFRADLIERISGIMLDVPPLRRRREDIPCLIAHFAARCVTYGFEYSEFSSSAIEIFQEYSWPRNVRQLKHAVERAIAASIDGVVAADVAYHALPRHDRSLADRTPGSRNTSHQNLRTSSQGALEAALHAYAGDTRQAAAALGVSRATIYRRMARLGLRSPRERGSTPQERPGSRDLSPGEVAF